MKSFNIANLPKPAGPNQTAITLFLIIEKTILIIELIAIKAVFL
jgi:hypothetical protein